MIDYHIHTNFSDSKNSRKNHIEKAKSLKEYDLTFELNTSGMDKECKEFYPSDEFLQILCDYKIPVTLGSDSHKVENLN
jgi:histidinol-phosphatase (PHP family)